MSCADSYDWHFTQGEDAILQLTYKDENGTAIDITGYSARCQGREEYTSATTLFDSTTGNGQIVLDEPNGVITITIPNVETAALSAPISGVWDVELVSGAGVVKNLIGGKLKIKAEVTK